METLNECSVYIMLSIIFLGCMFIMVNSVYRLYREKKSKLNGYINIMKMSLIVKYK